MNGTGTDTVDGVEALVEGEQCTVDSELEPELPNDGETLDDGIRPSSPLGASLSSSLEASVSHVLFNMRHTGKE